MSNGLTPFKKIRNEFIEEEEKEYFPFQDEKEKKDPVQHKEEEEHFSFQDEVETKPEEHYTQSRREEMRLNKDKRLLSLEIKKLQQILTDLGATTESIHDSNQDLRLDGIKKVAQIAREVGASLKAEREKVNTSLEASKEIEKELSVREDVYEKNIRALNKVMVDVNKKTKDLEEREVSLKNKKILVENEELRLKREKREHISRLLSHESDSKALEKRAAVVDTIYEDIDKDKSHVKRLATAVKSKSKSLFMKEQDLYTREVSLKDKEGVVRRLIEEARLKGIRI